MAIIMNKKEKQPRVYRYEYSALVSGSWDGEVKAKNKKDAEKKAREDMLCENLTPSEIEIRRV